MMAEAARGERRKNAADIVRGVHAYFPIATRDEIRLVHLHRCNMFRFCDKLRFCWSPTLNLPFFAIGPCPPPAPPVAVPFFRFPVVFPFAPSGGDRAACFAAFARSFSSSFAAFRSIFCFFFSSAASFASKVLAFFSSFDFVVFVVVVLVLIFFGFFSSLRRASPAANRQTPLSTPLPSRTTLASTYPARLQRTPHLHRRRAFGDVVIRVHANRRRKSTSINFASLNLTRLETRRVRSRRFLARKS